MSNERTPSSRHGVAMTTMAATLLLACAELPPQRVPSPSRAQGVLITRSEIRDSGARDAWEAIRKNVNHLRFTEDADGDPVWVGASRGSPSLTAPDAILLVVDGALMQSSGYLRHIPAKTVAYIQILSGSQGTARYGLAAGNGVVVVRTQAPARGTIEGDGTSPESIRH